MTKTLLQHAREVLISDSFGSGENPFFVNEFFLEIAKGNIPGHSAVTKFGENPDIDTNGFETIWDGSGTYVPPTQARLHTVASTSGLDAGTVLSSGVVSSGSLTTLVDPSATFISDGVVAGDDLLNDTNTELSQIASVPLETTLTLFGMRDPDFALISANPNAGGDAYRVVTNASTGASIFYILGLDPLFQLQREFVVLNGISGVLTTKEWIRQFRARVYGPGDNSPAVGTITSTAQTDGTVTCQIIDGNNQTLMAISTVPFPQNGYLLSWWASLSKKQAAVCNLKLRAGDLTRRMYVLESRSIDNTGNSSFTHNFDVPRPLTGGIDIIVESDSNANGTAVAAGFTYLLIDKE